MLTAGMRKAFDAGIKGFLEAGAQSLLQGQGVAPAPGPQLLQVSAQRFIERHALREEVFGPSSLIVRCADADQMAAVAQGLEGQLTATVHAEDTDLEAAGRLLPLLELKAGRILFNGWPTGVEVCHAMVHGGPFPATGDARFTAVGFPAAAKRFSKALCVQG